MDEIQNLILNVKGKQEAEQLRAALEAEEKTLRGLNDVIRQNGSLTAAQQQQQQQVAASMVAHQAELKKLESGFRSMGSSSLQLSYALQDLTSMNGDLLRGFMAIQNNVPGIVMALGGTMGVAGAVSAVSLAIALAAPHIAKFMESLDPTRANDFKTALEHLQESMKKLEDRKVKISTDATDLENVKKQIEKIQEGLEGFEEWKRQHTDWEKASGTAVAGALANYSQAAAARGGVLAKEEANQLQSYVPLADAQHRYKLVQDKMEKLQKFLDKMDPNTDLQQGTQARMQMDRLRKQRNAIAAEINTQTPEARKQAERVVGGLYAKATAGDRAAQEELAKRLSENGHDFLAARIRRLSPEQLKGDAEFEEGLGKDVAAAEKKEAKDEAARKLTRDLNAQGAEHQRIGTEERERDVKEDAAEAKRIREDYLRQAEHDTAELTKGLGDQFLDKASGEQARIMSLRGRSRVREQARFDAQLPRAARLQLQAAGVPEARIDELTPQVPALVTAHTDQQRTAANAMASMTGLPLPKDPGPQLQEVIAAQRGAIEELARQNAKYQAAFGQLGAGFVEMRRVAAAQNGNFGGFQQGAFTDGIGGNQPGHGFP